jgi:putative Mg2+ transporter-C (MgtC) family protein
MLDWKDIVIRLGLAALFGALIGLERERKNWAAGMRTHMMVCVGATLAMMISSFGFGDVLGRDHIVLDPSRIASLVLSGVGFIGAGAILSRQGTIRGLTTASGLWTVAAIGLATGGGMYFAAAAATVFALIILWILQPVEKRLTQVFKKHTLIVRTAPHLSITAIMERIEAVTGDLEDVAVERSSDGTVIQFTMSVSERKDAYRVIDLFKDDPQVQASLRYH